MIEVPVPAYRQLPDALTAPLLPPPLPVRNCQYQDGTPAVCLLDGLLQIPLYEVLLDVANEDRASAATLGKTDPEARNGR